jgi:hypothetical protein
MSSADRPVDFSQPENFLRLVSEFQQGIFPHKYWKHQAHLIVAAWYCCQYETTEAINQLRTAIQNYNNKNGIVNSDTSGYHETGTVFWTRIVAALISSSEGNERFPQAAETVLAYVAEHRELLAEYYSFDPIKSVEARKRWIEPDLKALPKTLFINR